VEFSEPIAVQVVTACRDLGLLANPLPPHTIRFMPPLIIGREEVDQAVAILDAALEQVVGLS
jgi:4-aminobutyrate aminotransferase-like enzyme